MDSTASLLAAALRLSFPLHPAQQSKCAPATAPNGDSVQAGPYIVYNNLWGTSASSSDSQCFNVDSLSASMLKWRTSYAFLSRSLRPSPRCLCKTIRRHFLRYFSPNSWTWNGAPSIMKLYPNPVVSLAPTSPSHPSLPSTSPGPTPPPSLPLWQISATTSSLSPLPVSRQHKYEIMVWLAAIGGAGADIWDLWGEWCYDCGCDDYRGE